MRRRIAALAGGSVLAAGAVVAPTVGSAQEEPPLPKPAIVPAPQPPPRTLVAESVIRPKRFIVKRSHFTPWVHPGPSGVRKVLAYEADRWGVSLAGLEHRVFCESGYQWWATNGQYEGIGQFASETFSRGMSSIGTRKVVLSTTTSRLKRSKVTRQWSDGTQTHFDGRLVRQRVRHVLVGWIPRDATRTHVWAQARIMARAIAGLGAVNGRTEWSCSL
jgi:hypothetical protein